MKRLALREDTLKECVTAAAQCLRRRGVVLYPTDTLYGLGADAFSDSAVDKIYELKARDERKPVHAVAADLAMVERYAEVGNDARLLAKRLWPGALTLVLKKHAGVSSGIGRGLRSIGFRVPRHEFCLGLAREFAAPYTTTSANLSGAEPSRSFEGILRQLGEASERIDLVIDAGTLPQNAPSTVVDLSGEEPAIVREGAIPPSDIWETLRLEE